MQDMTYIICHQSKLLISFLNEGEYIPEFSAENWFYKKPLLPACSSQMGDFSSRHAAKSEQQQMSHCMMCFQGKIPKTKTCFMPYS